MFRKMSANAFYKQLEKKLQEKIFSGYYPSGSMLPSESELCGEYQASRNSIRKALKCLAENNLIETSKGIGSSVLSEEERESRPRKTDQLRIMLKEAEFIDAFDRNIMAGVEEFAKANGCIVHSSSSEVPVATLLDDYRKFRFDGLIWVRGSTQSCALAAELQTLKIPQIMIEREVPGVPLVCFDSRSAFSSAVRILKQLGHESVSFVDFNLDSFFAVQRKKSFVEACDFHHCRGNIVILEAIPNADLQPLYNTLNHTTAYLCNAIYYSNLLKAVAACGRKIPGDISVIAVDLNDSMIDKTGCFIRVSLRKMGSLAAELVTRMGRRESVPFVNSIPGEVILGNSIGRNNWTGDGNAGFRPAHSF